jgi:hypothetical protein
MKQKMAWRVNDKAKSAASRFLRNFTAFQKSIACIGDSKADISNPNLGAFGLVLDSQRQIKSELGAPGLLTNRPRSFCDGLPVIITSIHFRLLPCLALRPKHKQ